MEKVCRENLGDNNIKFDNESYKEVYMRLKQGKDDKFSMSISKMKERYKTENDKHKKIEEPRMKTNTKPPQYIKNHQQTNGTFVPSEQTLDTLLKAPVRDTTEQNRYSGSKHDIKSEKKIQGKSWG